MPVLLEQDVHNQTQTAAAELELIPGGLLSLPYSREVRLPGTRPAPAAGTLCFQHTANNIFCGLHSQNANRFLCFALSSCLSRCKYFNRSLLAFSAACSVHTLNIIYKWCEVERCLELQGCESPAPTVSMPVFT